MDRVEHYLRKAEEYRLESLKHNASVHGSEEWRKHYEAIGAVGWYLAQAQRALDELGGRRAA